MRRRPCNKDTQPCLSFFIHRPVFAWVLAIIMMIAGGLAILQLPIAQYPTIAPPAVAISATYPGADAQTVQDTVTQVIEQNMNGIDNLMYMSSTSDSAGSVTITLTFKSGTDPDIAQVQVQNKLQLATPLLPQEVQQQGISVEKSSSSFPVGRRLYLLITRPPPRTIFLTMLPPMSKILLAASTAWAMCSCSARNTPCASGWMATC